MNKPKSSLQPSRKLRIRQLFLILVDVLALCATSLASLLVRYEFNINRFLGEHHLFNVLKLLPVAAVTTIVIFYLFGLYSSLWEYAGEQEGVKILIACLVSVMVQTTGHFITGLTVPRSFLLIEFILLFFAVAFTRFSYRYIRHKKSLRFSAATNKCRTLIIGAGETGAMTLRSLQRSDKSHNLVVCLADDDPHKIGKQMYGVPVAGSTDNILDMIETYKVEEIIFAIPTIPAKKRAKILEICGKTTCKLRTLPGISQLVNGEVDIQKIRDVQIEDLLFRESIDLNDKAAGKYYAGKTVLVTGGGGSIGSEICRQLATCHPKKLIIFDIYENNAYEIQQELIRNYGKELDLSVIIGSVRERKRLDELFNHYKPDIVFHAAAHKHVPLMEESPCEALKNNVFGTYNVADMAEKYGVQKFVLISTDKAVNPTNIMGASKRLCEMVIQCRKDSSTCFAAVRFGNVLGSNGSVIPLFKRQIAEGGPVTVTDKRIIRYFMTIPEASQLVMEAGALAKKGELFVLDMGKPVRIYDLAVNMIKLSGLEPDVDIQIKEIGLRPGEKLYEELLMQTEKLDKTENDMIFIEKDTPYTRSEVDAKLAILKDAIDNSLYENAHDFVKTAIKKTVPTFHDPEELNKKAHTTKEMQMANV